MSDKTPDIEALRRRSEARAEELRRAGPPCLSFPAGKSVIAVHADDAHAGVESEQFVMGPGL